jgi:CubicO group peptidase (beta-lactamase class C family)
MATPASGPDFAGAEAILAGALRESAFPCVVAAVGSSAGLSWQTALGTLTGEPDGPTAADTTIFDLASLTKVVATAAIAMRLVDRRLLGLDERVADRIGAWRGADRETVTIRDLLAHSSGLTAHLPFYKDCQGRDAFTDAICRLPLEYPRGTASVYSDLGFILLGFILEDVTGRGLGEAFAEIAALLSPVRLAFNPPAAWRSQTAPTGVDPWRGRLLVGEVHDGNAWALGGRAGHAGLFGERESLDRFARLVLCGLRDGGDTLARPETLRAFAARQPVPGSTRGLGWDTMKPTSSCGTRMRPSAIGHTGFTGTSLWIDWERDLYVVLLTNRVHPTAENNAILGVRRAFHDAVVDAWDAAGVVPP